LGKYRQKLRYAFYKGKNYRIKNTKKMAAEYGSHCGQILTSPELTSFLGPSTAMTFGVNLLTSKQRTGTSGCIWFAYIKSTVVAKLTRDVRNCKILQSLCLWVTIRDHGLGLNFTVQSQGASTSSGQNHKLATTIFHVNSRRDNGTKFISK
jgi:hypothetical protein